MSKAVTENEIKEVISDFDRRKDIEEIAAEDKDLLRKLE